MNFAKRRIETRNLSLRSGVCAFGLAVCLLLNGSRLLQAEGSYLTPGKTDGVGLLMPPPMEGSAEAAADLATVRNVFQGEGIAAKERALKYATLAFTLFQPAIGPVFQPGKLPKTEALLQRVKMEIGASIDTPKNYWKRKRPYQVDEELNYGKPEVSFSYPSGHSTRGTVYALVLAQVFPDKKEAILAIGREIGWDRIVIGKHYPTDVYAGRVLGQAIVRELLASSAFQHDLEEAKAEVAAAQSEVVTPAVAKP